MESRLSPKTKKTHSGIKGHVLDSTGFENTRLNHSEQALIIANDVLRLKTNQSPVTPTGIKIDVPPPPSSEPARHDVSHSLDSDSSPCHTP